MHTFITATSAPRWVGGAVRRNETAAVLDRDRLEEEEGAPGVRVQSVESVRRERGEGA
jgi:hypothetical protein